VVWIVKLNRPGKPPQNKGETTMSSAESSAPPVLDEATVSRFLTFDSLIPAMERTLVAYSDGKVSQPDRKIIPVEAHGDFFGAMPAVGEAVGLKIVTFYPGNAERGLPTHLAVIQLFDPETGRLMVTMDGRLVTEMRTAAVSASVVKKTIAADARVLAVLGTGVQAHVHVEAMTHCHAFDEIRVWGRSADKAVAFAAAVGGRAMTAEDAVRGADVVVTATASKTPVLEGAWLKPGAAIFAEAGEIIAGRKAIEPGRTVIFDSVGMACEDVAAAKLVWDAYTASA